MVELEKLVDATWQRDGNNLTLDVIKNWLKEYIRMHGEEVLRFPEERASHHWNFVSADYDRKKDAMFLLAFFHDDFVTFLAGRGDAEEIRDFGENSFPSNPDEVVSAMSARFKVADPVTVGRDETLRWLGS